MLPIEGDLRRARRRPEHHQKQHRRRQGYRPGTPPNLKKGKMDGSAQRVPTLHRLPDRVTARAG